MSLIGLRQWVISWGTKGPAKTTKLIESLTQVRQSYLSQSAYFKMQVKSSTSV
jgi:hypothetical protein